MFLVTTNGDVTITELVLNEEPFMQERQTTLSTDLEDYYRFSFKGQKVDTKPLDPLSTLTTLTTRPLLGI